MDIDLFDDEELGATFGFSSSGGFNAPPLKTTASGSSSSSKSPIPYFNKTPSSSWTNVQKTLAKLSAKSKPKVVAKTPTVRVMTAPKPPVLHVLHASPKLSASVAHAKAKIKAAAKAKAKAHAKAAAKLHKLESLTKSQAKKLAMMARKKRPISESCPKAYRTLACHAGVGGDSGLALLHHISDMVDLANARALATSEHNVINNTLAFRRAVLRGLRARRCK